MAARVVSSRRRPAALAGSGTVSLTCKEFGTGVHTAVGNGTLTFADPNNGSFDYMVHTTPRTTLSALAAREGTSNVFTGPIYRNSGPRFDAADAASVMASSAGTATFTFADGNDATFHYKVMVAPLPGPVTQSKYIIRFPFAAAGGTLRN